MVRHQSRVFAALAVTLLGGFPAVAAAQTRPGNPNAPMLVVVSFKTNDPAKKLGVDFAEAIRDKVQGDVSYRDLQVQSKANIDATLQASGYDMTAALTEGDANLLAKQLRADEYIEGSIDKTATGFSADAWMVLTFDQNQVQPLGHFEGAKVGDVAAQISKSYQAAHKVFDDVKKCRTAQRDPSQDAVAIATAGIAKYPRSTLLRICELTKMVDTKKPPADIIRVAQEILAIDPKSKVALQAEVDAYDAAGDKNKKIEVLTQLLASDSTNAKLQQTVVYDLAAAGQYEKAIAIVSKIIKDNPGDVAMDKLYWQLLYATKDFKGMVRVGDELVKLDTSMADTTYYDRTIEAYRADSAFAKAAEAAAKAAQKYPKRADYWAQKGQLELKTGQTQQAVASFKKALSIDPKIVGVRMLIVSSLVDAVQYDSALVAMHDAIAGGEPADPIAQIAVVMGNRELKVGQDTSKGKPAQTEAFHKVLSYVFFADTIAKDRSIKNNAKFLEGVSHFFLAQLVFNDMLAAKNCEQAKTVQDLVVNATLELPVGGATNPETVKALMPITTQMSTSADQAVKVFCAPPKGAPAKKP